MCSLSKWSKLFTWLLIVALSACTTAAAPVPPTPAPAAVATSAPVPQASDTPASSSSVTPKPGPSVRGKFDAGGVNLYIICLGDGNPTVVLDAGWGLDSMSWMPAMPKVRSRTRVCAYDRASMGASDSQSGLRTAGQMVEQLHTLLISAGIEGPYIIVGHSLGGFNARVFASRYAPEVVGVVLVDSPHPDVNDRELAGLPTPSPNEDEALAAYRKDLAWVNPTDEHFPEPMNWDDTLAQVRAVKSLGNIPLVVLSRDPDRDTGIEWAGVPNVLMPIVKESEKVWQELQKELATLSSDSQLIVVKNASHLIPEDAPQAVADTIVNLVDKVQKK